MEYIRGKHVKVYMTTESATAGLKYDDGEITYTTVEADMAVLNRAGVIDVSAFEEGTEVPDVLTIEYDPIYESTEHDTFNASAMAVKPKRRKSVSITLTIMGKDGLYGALYKQAPYGIDGTGAGLQSDLKDLDAAYGYRLIVYDGTTVRVFPHLRIMDYAETVPKDDVMIQEIRMEGYDWRPEVAIGVAANQAGGAMEVP